MSTYKIKVFTQDIGGAGTDSDISINLLFENSDASSGFIRLNSLKSDDVFEQGSTDEFSITHNDFGRVFQIKLKSNGKHLESDWDLDRIEVTSPDGYTSIFHYFTTVTGDETGETLTRNDVKFPWQVTFQHSSTNAEFIRHLKVVENAHSQSRSNRITRGLTGLQQVEISKEQQTGSSIGAKVVYESPETKFGKFSGSVGSIWIAVANNQKLDKNEATFSVQTEDELTLPANGILCYENIWSVPKFTGFIAEGKQKYAIRGLAASPTPLPLNTFLATEGGEATEGAKPLPYRFKNILRTGTSSQIQLLQKWSHRFQNPPAIKFDGSQTYGEANDVCLLMGGQSKPAFSFSCWAFPEESTNEDQTLVAFNTNTGGNKNMIGFNARRRQFFYFDPTTGYVHSNGNFSFNNWYHIHVSVHWHEQKGRLQMNFYIDGILITNAFTGHQPQPAGRFSIGQEWDGATTSDFFKGMLSDIRVWKRAISGEELRQNFRKRLAGTEEDLLAYYPCDEEEGNLLYDKTENGNNITLHNNVEWISNTELELP